MFQLTEEQGKKVMDWMSSHEPVYCGAIGGRYTYQFTPTSIGMVTKVIDGITNEELDVSDYDNW